MAPTAQPTLNGEEARKHWLNTVNIYEAKLRELVGIAGVTDKEHPATVDLARIAVMKQESNEKSVFFHRFLPGLESDALASFLALYRMTLSNAYWIKILPDVEQSDHVRKFIQSRLPDPKLYTSVLAELTYLGYLRARELDARFVEEDGRPDIRTSTGVWIEHKQLAATSGPDRIKAHIEKANKQIKNVGAEASGICAIHVSAIINGTFDTVGRFPIELEPHMHTVTSLMNSKNYKSVSAVVLYWDEAAILGKPEHGTMALHATRADFDLIESF